MAESLLRSPTGAPTDAAAFVNGTPVGGDLGGTLVNPTVLAFHESGANARLAWGDVQDARIPMRVGTTMVGVTPAAIVAAGGGGSIPALPDANPYALTGLSSVVGWSRLWIASGQLGPVPADIGPVVILAAGHDPGLYELLTYQRVINASAGVTGNLVTRVQYTELTTPPTPWGATLTQDSDPLSSLLNGQNSDVLVFPSDGSQDISITKGGLTIVGPPGTALSYIQFFLFKTGPFG